MLETFKTKYPSTRCILHCTKIFCQKPSLLFPQSNIYSSYQYNVTYKGMFAIAPSGVKSFIKELYAGCILQK